MSQALSRLHDAVCNGSFRGIEGLVQEALDAGHTALEILNLALAKGLEEAGDIHSTGKEILAAMLEASGFRVIDLGVDVKPHLFVERAVEHSADIIGISALMTTTMTHQQKVIEILKEQGLRDRFKVIER